MHEGGLKKTSKMRMRARKYVIIKIIEALDEKVHFFNEFLFVITNIFMSHIDIMKGCGSLMSIEI